MEYLSSLSLYELLALQLTNNLARYFLIAGLTYMVAWKWCFPRFKARFLYAEKPMSKHLKREIKFSVLTTMIFMLPTLTVIGTQKLGWSQIYMEVSEKGMLWYGLSFVVVFVLHDSYFYWTHRLMHTRKLYPLFHKTHHLSIEPSPLAAFAFHPLEAIVESGLFILLPLLLPFHWSVLVLFTLFSLFMNVYGHLGFNVFKPETLRNFPLNLLSHSTHHSWHHRFHKGNYGFYLQMWDKLMGTWEGELPPPIKNETTV